jgi:signal transduction histidine kinase
MLDQTSPRRMPRQYCEIADCGHLASRGGLCWTCYNRRRRGGLRIPRRGRRFESLRERIRTLELELANTDSEPSGDAEFVRAEARLRMARLEELRQRIAREI